MDIGEAIRKRTMVREYAETPLTRLEVEKILEAGIRAPTASANEQWYFVVVESQPKRDDLYRLLIEAQKIYYTRMLKEPLNAEKVEKWVSVAERGAFKAPLYIAIFIDLRERFCTIPEIEELWAHQSVAAAIENMLLEAWGMGVGACWYGVPLLMEGAFYDLLGSSAEGLKLVAVLGFGRPKKEQPPRPRKKPLATVMRTI